MNKITNSMLTAIIGLSLSLSPFSASLTRAATDVTPPSIPENLTSLLNVSGQVFLTWSPATDNVNVTGYTILRNNVVLTNTTNTSYIDTSVSPDTAYSYKVLAYDAAGNVSSTSTLVSITTTTSGDKTAPIAPTNLLATIASSTQVNLSWATSTDNVAVTGYMLMRNNSILVNTIAPNFIDSSVLPDTTYTYSVLAYDAAGNVSALSNIISVKTAINTDFTAPSIPVTLLASVISNSQINLNWLVSTDNVAVTGYNIYRNGILIATANSNSFSDTALTASTTYTYSISAFDAVNNTSAKSSSVSATTLVAPIVGDIIVPTMPTNLVATSSTSTQVVLTWTASTDNVGVTAYIVTRSSSAFGHKAVKVSGFLAISPVNSFTDNSAKANTTYFYKVIAFDAAGNISNFSDKALITTAKKSENIKKDEHKEDHEMDKKDNKKELKSNNGNHFGQIKQANNLISIKSNDKIKKSSSLGQLLKFQEHKDK